MAHKVPVQSKHEEPKAPTRALFDLARESRWSEFLSRCKTHPEDAKWIYILSRDSGRRVTVRNYEIIKADSYTLLHFLVAILQPTNIPKTVFAAAMKAYPEAITTPSPKEKTTPLDHVISRYFQRHYNVHSHMLNILELMVESLTPASLDTLQSALPLVLPEVLQYNIIPFLENYFLEQDAEGNTLLHRLFNYGLDDIHSHGRDHICVPVLKAVLQAEPKAASMLNHGGATPLHLAAKTCSCAAHLQLLVDVYPNALTMLYEGDTPLVLYLKDMRENFGSYDTHLDRLKILAETKPQAVLIPSCEGDLPWRLVRGNANIRRMRALMEETQGHVLTDEHDRQQG